MTGFIAVLWVLARSYQEKLADLLAGAGWEEPYADLDEEARLHLGVLLAKLSDLMYDYRDEQESL